MKVNEAQRNKAFSTISLSKRLFCGEIAQRAKVLRGHKFNEHVKHFFWRYFSLLPQSSSYKNLFST